MPFDAEEFFRQHGTNPKTRLSIRGHGTVTIEGLVDEPGDPVSLADLLAKQQPTRKVLAALVALVANQPPTDSSSLQALCQILAQQPPTNELLKSLADLVAEENPHIYSLVDGQPATQSTLNTLVGVVARQTPCKRIMQSIADLLVEQAPSPPLLKALADVVRKQAAGSS
jgi:hypothetical protein